MELILVMLIAATALALAAPRLTGWSRGARLRSCGEEFVRMTRLARARAVSDATVYRILIDSQTVNFKLMRQQGTEFVDVQETLGRNVVPLTNAKIEVVRNTADMLATGSAADAIDFFPSGRTQPMQIRLTNELGHTVNIECKSPAEDFQIVSTQSQS
jgi:Tfp pilus assembly protein FimT